MRGLRWAACLALLFEAGAAPAVNSAAPPVRGPVTENAADLTLGQAWPQNYGSADLPPYTIAHYGLGITDDWRRASHTVYRIDQQTRAVTAIVALVTGDNFTIGKRAPAGYDIYNIPIAHRDRWQDGPAAQYRYADGRIYRIDPRTRLVTEAFDLPAIPRA